MLEKLFTAASIVIIAVIVGSSFAAQTQVPADNESGLHCWLYTGKYHNFKTVEEGCTTLPRTVHWQVDDTTGYPDRITVRLRDGNFLPLVSQMDVETAKRLHAELGEKIATYDSKR